MFPEFIPYGWRVMTSALSTILPIFIVIGLGYAVRRKGWLTEAFMASGNRILYWVAIPCLLFYKISTAPFQRSFYPHLILGCVGAIFLMWVAMFLLGRLLSFPPSVHATFVQVSIHGNIGYIGLAVCYYSFNDRMFGIAGVLAGFFIITQNVLSVTSYQVIASQRVKHRGEALWRLMVNPIILSTLTGLGFSFFRIALPMIIVKTLMIIGKMALPTALMIIGGSLNMGQVFTDLRLALASSFLKMIGLPLLGIGVFRFLSVSRPLWAVGLVLLSAPSAVTSYIMSRELHGDPDLASSAVTTSTLLSLFTFILWLSLSG